MYLRNYGLRRRWLDKCLKNPASEDPSSDNMVNGIKHCFNLNGSIFGIFIITLKIIEFEKVSLSDMQNLKTVY